jgi:hypothetical protein
MKKAILDDFLTPTGPNHPVNSTRAAFARTEWSFSPKKRSHQVEVSARSVQRVAAQHRQDVG